MNVKEDYRMNLLSLKVSKLTTNLNTKFIEDLHNVINATINQKNSIKFSGYFKDYLIFP